jgi:hypothetical protein
MSDTTERRHTERFPVTATTKCEFAAPLVSDLGPVVIHNISMDGIGLRLSCKVDNGAVLAIGLVNEARGFNRVLLVHVFHVTALPGGAYLIGGRLDPPLTYQDLTALVM